MLSLLHAIYNSLQYILYSQSAVSSNAIVSVTSCPGLHALAFCSRSHCSSQSELTRFQLPNSELNLTPPPLAELSSVGLGADPMENTSPVDADGMVSRVPLQRQRLADAGPCGNTTSCSSPIVAWHQHGREVFLCCICNHWLSTCFNIIIISKYYK